MQTVQQRHDSTKDYDSFLKIVYLKYNEYDCSSSHDTLLIILSSQQQDVPCMLLNDLQISTQVPVRYVNAQKREFPNFSDKPVIVTSGTKPVHLT